MGVPLSRRVTWGVLVAAVIGGVVGAIVGLILAINFAILIGAPGGAEAGIAEVFGQNPLAGAVDALILCCGPVLGVWVGLRIHARLMR